MSPKPRLSSTAAKRSKPARRTRTVKGAISGKKPATSGAARSIPDSGAATTHSAKAAVNNVVFVTGSDTGVGKTVLTSLLLAHLRARGTNALALKPFCSGGREDAEILWRLQAEEVSLDEVNPYYFDKPLAPVVAASRRRPAPSLRQVVDHVNKMAARCDVLLIEGAGGLLVPLGADYTIATLIEALDCPVLVVSANQLGTINHTLLTLNHMQAIGIKAPACVLMSQMHPDVSSATNPNVLRKMAPETEFLALPHLKRHLVFPREIKKCATFLKKTLARISDVAIVTRTSRCGSERKSENKTS